LFVFWLVFLFGVQQELQELRVWRVISKSALTLRQRVEARFKAKQEAKEGRRSAAAQAGRPGAGGRGERAVLHVFFE
jgi:hypothetical protein